jgi:excisionase family DNA binding protein
MQPADNLPKTHPVHRPRRPPKPTDPEILTAQDAAAALGVSTRLVLRLARKKLLPGMKIGRTWRFLRGELRKALAGDRLPETLEALLRDPRVNLRLRK